MGLDSPWLDENTKSAGPFILIQFTELVGTLPSLRQAITVRIAAIFCTPIFGQGMSDSALDCDDVRSVAKSMMMAPESGPNYLLEKRLRFCCPPILAGIGGGIVFAAGLVLFLPQPEWRVTVAGLVLAVLPLFLFFLVRLPWVFLSIRRYNKQAYPFQ